MKQTLTTYAMTTAQLLHAALSGNRDAQRLFEYGNPQRPAEGDYDEEARLDSAERARDMNSAPSL